MNMGFRRLISPSVMGVLDVSFKRHFSVISLFYHAFMSSALRRYIWCREREKEYY